MTLRRVLFWTHLSLGLAAGGVILSMALSGLVLAYEPQITAWAERDSRVVTPYPGTERLPLEELLGKAQQVISKGRPFSITLRSDPAASVAISFGNNGGSLYLNPYTGIVLGGESRIHAFLHSVENWHRWFGSRDLGRPITGAACLIFGLLLISGLFLWWPRRWTKAGLKPIAMPNFSLRGRARDWNWHHVVGFWSAPFLLITISTGLVIAYPWANDLLFAATGNKPPPRPQEEKRSPMGSGPRMAEERKAMPRAHLDTLWAKAQALASTWSSMSVRLPRKTGDPIAISVIASPEAHAWERSQLTLHAVTAEVIRWEPYERQNLGRRLRAWIVPLHTGRAGGWFGQGLALVAAAAAALMVWTGMAMSWRRFFKPSSRHSHAGGS